METALIIIGYTLVSGSYIYTWKSVSRLWKAMDEIRTNELIHIKKRLKDLEDTPFRESK